MSRRLLWLLGSAAVFVLTVNLGLGTFVIDQPPATVLIPSSLSTTTRPSSLPPLPVWGYNITGDVDWLLQFAIIGFPKTGTSTLMFHLQSLSQVGMFDDERCELGFNQQARLIRDLYTNLTQYPVKGIKCPGMLENTKLAMPNLQHYFPSADLIVGLRHPVLWFESFYNFRIHNEFPMPPPMGLIGGCNKGMWGVCTLRANFHLFLSNLGYTAMADDEQRYFDRELQRRRSPVARGSRRLFLYEIRQLANDDKRSAVFRSDLQAFLGLTQPIPPLMWFKPGRVHDRLDQVNAQKIDICQAAYDPLRVVLMKSARDASRWIRLHLMQSPSVVVSSPDYFDALLHLWEVDPCRERRAATKG